VKVLIQFERQFEFFLTKDKAGNRFEYVLTRKASVKDIIESFGVPHTEIGRIYFNQQAIDFSYILSSEGVLRVYAIPVPFNVFNPSVLRPDPITHMTFVADVNVIRLGRLLILLGFDVAYSSFYSDSEIADIAEAENRIVLSRDTDLLKRKKIVFAKRVKADLPYDQLVEVVDFFGLHNLISFFSRCTTCNVKLLAVAKKDVIHLLEPKTKQYFDTFFQCPLCNSVFWRGSHYDNIQKKMASIGVSTDLNGR